MKQLYQRSSTTTSADRVDPALREAINAHAEAHQLGAILTVATAVCETHSVRLHRNSLLAKFTRSGDPDREHRTVALLTPGHLIIGVSGDQRGVHVRSARLETISLTPGHAFTADSGLSVVAHWSGATADQANAAFYLGLGDDPAGQAFTAELTDAVARAKAT